MRAQGFVGRQGGWQLTCPARAVRCARHAFGEAAGAEALSAGDVAPLGKDIVHSVTNPIPRLTGALHVYGGNFFADGRSEWDPETLSEQPYDMQGNMQLFEKSNSGLSLN